MRSYEVLFFTALAWFLTQWIGVASRAERASRDGRVTWPDATNALVNVFLCYVAFFGTGNVASISTFQVASVYRFTTLFAPFLMGIILVWKLLIPNILVSLAFACINRQLNVSPKGAACSRQTTHVLTTAPSRLPARHADE